MFDVDSCRDMNMNTILNPNTSDYQNERNVTDLGNGTEVGPTCEGATILQRNFLFYPFLICYILVFISCITGNTLLLLVIGIQRSMRTSTNFFLANLAVADLLVGCFCVAQNCLHIFVFRGTWPLGSTLCRMYMFVVYLVPCVSSGILILLSIEKYIAVLHPMAAKKVLTKKLLAGMAAMVWLVSIIANSPHFMTAKLFDITDRSTLRSESVCGRDMNSNINLKAWFTSNFVVWYCIPLLTLLLLYSKIGFSLYQSSRGIARSASTVPTRRKSTVIEPRVRHKRSATLQPDRRSGAENNSDYSMSRCETTSTVAPQKLSSCSFNGRGTAVPLTVEEDSLFERNRAARPKRISQRTTPKYSTAVLHPPNGDLSDSRDSRSKSIASGSLRGDESPEMDCLLSRGVGSLRVRERAAGAAEESESEELSDLRRRVIRLLVMIILAFALLSLPNHLRLVWSVFQTHHRKPKCPSIYLVLAQPLCFLLLFANSSVNPILYAFFSARFRGAVKSSLQCKHDQQCRALLNKNCRRCYSAHKKSIVEFHKDRGH